MDEELLPKHAGAAEPVVTRAPSRARQFARTALKNTAGLVLLVAVWKLLLYSSGYKLSVAFDRHDVQNQNQKQNQNDNLETLLQQLDAIPALTTKAPKRNIWQPISPEDNAAVWNWLHDPAQGLNLTAPDIAGINDNMVRWIDTVPLNKTDVLPFIDGAGAPPPSYARVIVHEGGKVEPVVQEYMVGPLPVGPATTLSKLDYLFNGGTGGTVPYNARGSDSALMVAVDAMLTPVLSSISDVTKAVFSGAQYWGATDNRTNLVLNGATPISFDGKEAHLNINVQFHGPARYLLPVDFYILVDITGTDTTLWSVRGFVTRSRLFKTEAELRAAFEAGELWSDVHQRQDYDWALVKQQKSMGERPLERRPAPQSREVGGKRYKVDADAQYIEYMGWAFYVGGLRPLGPMFYDVKFKGERILYEMSLQEAASQYGGFQPKAASTVYHDASYSLMANLFPMIAGFDCPAGSTFWNASYHQGNTTVVRENAICIFEQDPGHPLSRHRATERDSGATSKSSSHVGVVKDAALHVRFIATVGNYDYIFDYGFGLDGAIEITVRASGYLMSSAYYKDQGQFGPRIQQGTQGSIHDHILTFKADFDIAGETANSLQRTKLVAVEQEQPWFENMGAFELLQLESDVLDVEQPLSWTPNGDTTYTVLGSKTSLNAWGERRGYRIVPGRSNMHLTTLKSPWSKNNMAYAKTHLAVTRQHDNEPLANSVHNAHLPAAPHVDFAKFMDGESVQEEDLVVWFNLGMHHFTRAEDVPVTLFSEAVSSITLAPQNFFDRAQDGDLTNRMWEDTTKSDF
ncbi:copper amine oxidase [Ophiostoma piceae UAMH 11346]|uniref:Amine oxidase n=1 Tax=Ophiostoma piceae (strain UAMH 11346) TaxID=1262450 RepID=S3BU27_OPHP1|nr:copper amine oxidase [Ophiostoma piceae UAMH 11346]